MKRTAKNMLALVMVLLLLLTAACAPGTTIPLPSPPQPSPEEVTPPPSPQAEPALTTEWGIIEVRVTDPPPPGVVSAFVTLTKIEVHRATDNTSGLITIIDEEVTFNLFDVTEEAAILGSDNVTAGKYTQIRMEVTEVTGFTTDNVAYTAEVPSGKLKLIKPFNVEPGQKTILTIDFDGDKSLIVTGAGKFLFRPVIKLTIEYEELPE